MKKKNNRIYKVQLYISLVSVIVFISMFLVYKYNIEKQEKLSESLLNNYSVSKLYSNSNIDYSYDNSNDIIGIIEIPKIDISYPVFANLSDDLLKISPCKFYGSMPNSVSNLCIAGHNYDNGKFFSNLNQLTINDNIYIYNNLMKKFIYSITDIYEVEANDWSPIISYVRNKPLLTLITCNNKNKRRLIIKAELIQ